MLFILHFQVLFYKSIKYELWIRKNFITHAIHVNKNSFNTKTTEDSITSE